jgi:hypothetical protein
VSVYSFLSALPALLALAGFIVYQILGANRSGDDISKSIVKKIRPAAPKGTKFDERLNPAQVADLLEAEGRYRDLVGIQDFELLKRALSHQFVINLFVYICSFLLCAFSVYLFVSKPAERGSQSASSPPAAKIESKQEQENTPAAKPPEETLTPFPGGAKNVRYLPARLGTSSIRVTALQAPKKQDSGLLSKYFDVYLRNSSDETREVIAVRYDAVVPETGIKEASEGHPLYPAITYTVKYIIGSPNEEALAPVFTIAPHGVGAFRIWLTPYVTKESLTSSGRLKEDAEFTGKFGKHVWEAGDGVPTTICLLDDQQKLIPLYDDWGTDRDDFDRNILESHCEGDTERVLAKNPKVR